jgi:hypothetical protein
MSTPITPPGGNSPRTVAPEQQHTQTGHTTTASGQTVTVTVLPPDSGPQLQEFVPQTHTPPPSPKPVNERNVSLIHTPSPSPSPSPGPAIQSDSPLSDRALKLMITEDSQTAAHVLKQLCEEEPEIVRETFAALVGLDPLKANEVMAIFDKAYPELHDTVSPPPPKKQASPDNTPVPGRPSRPSPGSGSTSDLPPSQSYELTRMLQCDDVSGAAKTLYFQAKLNPEHFGRFLSKFAEQAPERYIDVCAFINKQAALSKYVAWLSNMIAKEGISATPRAFLQNREAVANSAMQLFHVTFDAAAHVLHDNLMAVVTQFNEEHFRPFYLKPISIEPSSDVLQLKIRAEKDFRANLRDDVPSGSDPKLVEHVMKGALASVSHHEFPWLQDIAVVAASLDEIIGDFTENVDKKFPWEYFRAATVCVAKEIFSAGFTAFYPPEIRPVMVREITREILLFLKEVDTLHMQPQILRNHPMLPVCEDLVREEFRATPLPPQFAARKKLIDEALPEGFAPLEFTLDCLPNNDWEQLLTQYNQAFSMVSPETMEEAIDLMRAVIKSCLPQMLQDSIPDSSNVEEPLSSHLASAYSLQNRIANAFYAIQLGVQADDFSRLVAQLADTVVELDMQYRPKAYQPPK